MQALVLGTILLALVAANLVGGLDQQPQPQPQQQQLALKGAERQGRSLGGDGSNSISGHGVFNLIEHSSSKKIEQERRQVQEFLAATNIFKSLMKLFFGNREEMNATSRNVLAIFDKTLDLVKNFFGQRYRSSSGRTVRDSAEDAAYAAVSIVQGYVKSVLTDNEHCVQRYLCEASRGANRDGRELGDVVASIGGYATSYLLGGKKSASFSTLYEAASRGRSLKEDCAKLYKECPETK